MTLPVDMVQAHSGPATISPYPGGRRQEGPRHLLLEDFEGLTLPWALAKWSLLQPTLPLTRHFPPKKRGEENYETMWRVGLESCQGMF